VKSVLIELGQTPAHYEGKLAVIGRTVPWLLLMNEDMPQVGTRDVDLGIPMRGSSSKKYRL
jgi:hypothetical protein